MSAMVGSAARIGVLLRVERCPRHAAGRIKLQLDVVKMGSDVPVRSALDVEYAGEIVAGVIRMGHRMILNQQLVRRRRDWMEFVVTLAVGTGDLDHLARRYVCVGVGAAGGYHEVPATRQLFWRRW